MKNSALLISLLLVALIVNAQKDSLTASRFAGGLSAPELLHLGVNVDLGKSNQLGLNAGIGPTWGGIWPTVSAEHRLYFGNISTLTNRRKWFFRQSFTYFPAGENDRCLTLTGGADLRSKTRNRGWTIDAGIYILSQKYEDRRNMIFPALRFQYYSYFKKT